MIKYLGSKRRLVPVLGAMAQAIEARTAIDLFTGTTRVAQEFKRRGIEVTAADVASYSGILSDCYIATDARDVDPAGLSAALDDLAAVPPRRGYVTETFCEQARYFHPDNGARIDAIREAIEAEHAGSPLYPVLLTALLLAADRVDSTTGLQMAYLKQWAPRALTPLQLRPPELLAGTGHTVVGDIAATLPSLPRADLAYLDPPYNQHRYFANYHVWETLVRWDAPEHYGVACKRLDARDPATKSAFNSKPGMPRALAATLAGVRAETVIVSYNDESWITPEQMTEMLCDAGHEQVQTLAFDAKRYVGAQIGIHNPAGDKVGTISHLRNTELLFVAGPREHVQAAVAAAAATSATAAATLGTNGTGPAGRAGRP